jgi:hypothetical protein
MAVTDEISFWEMYRELPVRTTLASVVPLVLGLAQLLNGYVHGVSVTRTGTFTVGMTMAAVLVTRYHLVEFHRIRLQRELYGEE